MRSDSADAAWWNFTVGPVDFRGHAVVIRPPRLSDGTAWRNARLANRARLESAFGAYGTDWEAEQHELAWAERCLALRRAARAGAAYPAVMVAPESPVETRFLGEAGIDSVDLRTRTGELSAWTSALVPSGRLIRWAAGTTVLRAFTAPAPLLRVIAPVATGNRGPRGSLLALGFECELTLTDHRAYNGRFKDHHIYVIHNTASSRARLRSITQNQGIS